MNAKNIPIMLPIITWLRRCFTNKTLDKATRIEKKKSISVVLEVETLNYSWFLSIYSSLSFSIYVVKASTGKALKHWNVKLFNRCDDCIFY